MKSPPLFRRHFRVMPHRIAAAAAAGEARGPPALPPRETHLPSPPLPRFHPHRRASERVPPLPPRAQAVRAKGSGCGWGRESWAGGGRASLENGGNLRPAAGRSHVGSPAGSGREASGGGGRSWADLSLASLSLSGRERPSPPAGNPACSPGAAPRPGSRERRLHPAREERRGGGRGGGREPRNSRSS